MKKTTAKKVPAKRGRPSRQAGVLLERTDKVVTKDKNTVLKIFGPSYKVSAILNEAMNEARAAETGLPVAKVLEVLKIRDHWCIRREWVDGDTLADVMAKDKKNLVKYLKEFVAIQCQIFAKTSERMGNLADKLDKQISASPLPKETRYDLHMKLQSFPRGKALCHGDFNPTNVIITPKGDWRVIDWSHVRLGDPLADVARTCAQGEAPRRAEVAADRRRGGIVARPDAEEPRAPRPLGERRGHRVVHPAARAARFPRRLLRHGRGQGLRRGG